MGIVKPTLLQLRKQTETSSRQLAEEAGVTLSEAYLVEIGGFVSTETVEKVVAAFNRLTNAKLSKHDIAYNGIHKIMGRVSL